MSFVWKRLPILAITAIPLTLWPASGRAEPGQPKPRLAVMLVFDQLCSQYVTQWREQYSPDGFNRILNDGAWFPNCHYPYATTVTAAGHASVATGCSPNKHGIVGNEWYDRAAKSQVYCVGTDRFELIPPGSEPDGVEDKKKTPAKGTSPDRLLAPTLADALKDATNGKSKVVSISFKDRSAMLPGGKRPDACYWFEGKHGRFISSNYYRDALHPWIASINDARTADRWFGLSWNRLRPDLDYARFSGPDDVKGEGKGSKQGRTFPHPMDGELKKPGKAYYDALFNSPFGNELLLEVAKQAIDCERLGQHEDPDLLCLSFSCNDPVGHSWGPDSQEVFDMMLRTDLLLAELLRFLDKRIGEGKYVLALSSDHGVCPLPEVTWAKGQEAAERVPPALLAADAEAFLSSKFGKLPEKVKWIESTANASVYFNRSLLKSRGVRYEEMESAFAEWIAAKDGIQAAYTRTQIEKGMPAEDVIGTHVVRSYFAERSGDVMVVLKPHCLFSAPLTGTGTSHGTPHAYDTHVPLLAFGSGICKGVHSGQTTPQASALILAKSLRIPPPALCDATLPPSWRN